MNCNNLTPFRAARLSQLSLFHISKEPRKTFPGEMAKLEQDNITMTVQGLLESAACVGEADDCCGSDGGRTVAAALHVLGRGLA